MINILSYIGMNIQSEMCLWTLLGLVRTIFDATLFKVNANLKQVWQMTMPEQLSMPVQRALRTMISGVMLVQCFTVYVYLAAYIVLLYPVFLEERPALVLPWLLIAAIRRLLCELTSLALGLGTCVLLGPARPPCVKFVVWKLISIMPAFYMWMLVFSYYHALKVAAAFKTFPVVLQSSDHDYGVELAIRRRRTKSLFKEDQLRCKIVARLYGERPSNASEPEPKSDTPLNMTHSTNTSNEDLKTELDIFNPNSLITRKVSETGSYEDWYGNDFSIPRDADRILEQFVLMLLRIAVYLRQGDIDLDSDTFKSKSVASTLSKRDNLNPLPPDDTETPPQVGSKGNTASYVREYPKIFMKRSSELPCTSELYRTRSGTMQSLADNDTSTNIIKTREKKRVVSISPKERVSIEVERIVRQSKKIPDDLIQSSSSKEGSHTKSQVTFDCKSDRNSKQINISDSSSLISIMNSETHSKNNFIQTSNTEYSSKNIKNTDLGDVEYDTDISNENTDEDSKTKIDNNHKAKEKKA